MAKRLNARSIKSRQKGLLRYIVSTDVDTAAKDFGVSTDALRRYIGAKPETVKKTPERFDKLLNASPIDIASAKQIKLVQRLSGKRLAKAYGTYYGNERLTRAVRLAQATRETKLAYKGGQAYYTPIDQTKAKSSRKQILNNMGGTTSASIIEQYKQGTLKESEARAMISQLWKNSGAAGSMEYFDDATE